MTEQIEHLNALLSAIEPIWPRVCIELEARAQVHIDRLIGQEDEQARGAIKALRELIDLPVTLKSERDHYTAELSERDSAS